MVDRREALFYFYLQIDPPMKALKPTILFIALFFCINNGHAQTSSSSPSQSALIFADSFLKSFRNNDVEQYVNLSYPGVISYYGGNKNFREYVQRAGSSYNSTLSENISLVQIVRDVSELQCVIQKTCISNVDGKKAQIVSYMVGQSKDDGQSWKFVDVALNSPGNLVYIMPDISAKLAVPQRQVIFAQSTAAESM